jgi:hypothetical protein
MCNIYPSTRSLTVRYVVCDKKWIMGFIFGDISVSSARDVAKWYRSEHTLKWNFFDCTSFNIFYHVVSCTIVTNSNLLLMLGNYIKQMTNLFIPTVLGAFDSTIEIKINYLYLMTSHNTFFFIFCPTITTHLTTIRIFNAIVFYFYYSSHVYYVLLLHWIVECGGDNFQFPDLQCVYITRFIICTKQ